MSLKRLVILSILPVSFLVAHASAIGDTIPQDTIWFDDGAWYYGQISDSLFNGYGKMSYADSTVYQGEWKDGLWDGEGEVFFPDGDYYKGQFKKHQFSGYGTYIYSDSSRYEGYWENGMFNGAGTMYYADGSTYAGEWRNDQKNGLGVYYDASNNSLVKGHFINGMYAPWIKDDDTPGSGNPNRTPAPQIPDDGKVHLRGMTSIFASYGLEQALSLHVDFHTSDLFFAGFSLGFNTAAHRRGEVSVTYDDETGERNVLIDWDDYPDEIMTETTYNMFGISGECGINLGRFSLGAAAGFSLKNTVRNCRSLAGNDSYYDTGTLYYREKVTGVRFAYDIFSDFILSLPQRNIYSISLRTGYSNIYGFHIGAGLTF